MNRSAFYFIWLTAVSPMVQKRSDELHGPDDPRDRRHCCMATAAPIELTIPSETDDENTRTTSGAPQIRNQPPNSWLRSFYLIDLQQMPVNPPNTRVPQRRLQAKLIEASPVASRSFASLTRAHFCDLRVEAIGEHVWWPRSWFEFAAATFGRASAGRRRLFRNARREPKGRQHPRRAT